MITTVTLNPAIDRVYIIRENKVGRQHYVYSPEHVHVGPGGKGLICAVDLHNLGVDDVQNIGFIGGRQGIFFERMVQDKNVITNYIYTENEIRNNIKIIGTDPVTYTSYNSYAYEVNEHDLDELIRRFSRSISESDYVILAGAIPKGVPFDIYRKLIQICHQQGKKVFLYASGEALKLAVEEKPAFVMPYFKHSNKIMDMQAVEEQDYVNIGRKILENGVQYAIVPYHCDYLLFSENRVFRLSPKKFCLMSWLGAGDAYVAGFMSYLMHNEFDFLEANRIGGAAALHVAETENKFLENRSDTEDRLDDISIEEWEAY